MLVFRLLFDHFLAFGYSLNIVGFFGLGFKHWFYGSVFLVWSFSFGLGHRFLDLIFSPRIGLEVTLVIHKLVSRLSCRIHDFQLA